MIMHKILLCNFTKKLTAGDIFHLFADPARRVRQHPGMAVPPPDHPPADRPVL